MKGKYILFLICSLFLCEVSAQTLEQARTLFTKGEYEQAKPVFKKYTKSQPSNGNYNYWYGVCCLKTGEAEEAVKPLEIAVKKRITGGQLYLGQAYNETYRFEDAVNCFEEYIADLSKRKKPTEEAEKLLEKSKSDLRMLKGVEEVCIIDSFVVDKATFLNAYKISEESGKLFTFNEFFKTEGDHPGTVYETEIGNKIYYSEKGEKGNLDIFSKSKIISLTISSNLDSELVIFCKVPHLSFNFCLANSFNPSVLLSNHSSILAGLLILCSTFLDS